MCLVEKKKDEGSLNLKSNLLSILIVDFSHKVGHLKIHESMFHAHHSSHRNYSRDAVKFSKR